MLCSLGDFPFSNRAYTRLGNIMRQLSRLILREGLSSSYLKNSSVFMTKRKQISLVMVRMERWNSGCLSMERFCL